MGGVQGFRRRLVVTFVGLVALTVLSLGIGAYLLVSYSLNQRLLEESARVTDFNVSVLAAERLPERPSRADFEGSGLAEAFGRRGGAGTIVDFGDRDPFVSNLRFRNVPARLSPALRRIVAAGNVGYERLTVDDQPYLVTGARLPPAGPDFYFLFSASEVEDALSRLRQALAAGGVVLVLFAALAGRLLARQVLTPVRDASAAAVRIEQGDLSARVPVSSHDEFGTWAASFNRMAASLQEKVAQLQEAQARQRRFVSDVSHELRTPLTALVNEAAMLKAYLDAGRLDGLDPEARRIGELLAADVRRLRGLVDDLIEISRFDAAAEEVAPSEFDLAEFLRAVVASRSPGARLHVPDAGLPVRTDPRRLERIVGNLLDNAREHGGASEVEVSAGVQRDVVAIEVADRGPGVPPQDLSRIFERFYKADPSRHHGSSGLGLAIAAENARLLGGSLEARLRRGGGVAFELRLPVTGPLPAGGRAVTSSSHPRRQPGRLSERTGDRSS
ncbi:MAG: HAMP domain-containing histidine kinase [Chloroflexota bacterium]|nr:HAMP domain-containing histidine kinase [Chloroflexota bacterium]